MREISAQRHSGHPDRPSLSLIHCEGKKRVVRSAVNERFKRAFDLAVSLTALMVFAPVMGVVALLVKLSSPGPVLFRQERMTQGERPFHIYKFRTMVADAEAKTGPTWVQANDDRVTPLGRVLRRTHLDELPQLFNVIRGDMSVVGPRPERPVFVARFKEQGVAGYEYRHLAKTGITGYAQLRNPDPSIDEIQDKTDDDLWYIAHWTPGLDCAIVWQTFLLFVKSLIKALPGVRRLRKTLAESAEQAPVTLASQP